MADPGRSEERPGRRQGDVAGERALYAPSLLPDGLPPSPGTLRGPFLAGWVASPPEHAQAKGRLRILFLGGSTTACMYPHHVRDEIENRLGPTTIYILGYDWHCSLHSLYKIWTYGDDVNPDLVVVLENVNDFYRGFTSPDTSLPVYRSDYSHSSGGLHPFWLQGRSRFEGRDEFFARPGGKFDVYEERDDSLAAMLGSALRESALLRSLGLRLGRRGERAIVAAPMPEEVTLRALPDFERNMRNIALSCRTKGLTVLFLTMPFTTGSGRSFLPPGNFFTNDYVHHLSPEGFARGMDRFNEVVRSLRDEPAAWVLPLAGAISDPKLFTDEVHLTDEGQRLEAHIVSKFIVEHALLKEPRNR